MGLQDVHAFEIAMRDFLAVQKANAIDNIAENLKLSSIIPVVIGQLRLVFPPE